MCAWIIRWAELPRIWILWAASIMAIVADYREARIDSKWEMGPKIADSFDWVDATFPTLAVIVYLIYLRRTTRRFTQSTVTSSDAGGIPE